MVMQTLKAKSLLPSLYKREEFLSWVSFSCLWTGKEGPFDRAHGHELVEWLGEISRTVCLLNYGLFSNFLLDSYLVRNSRLYAIPKISDLLLLRIPCYSWAEIYNLWRGFSEACFRGKVWFCFFKVKGFCGED